MHLHSPREIRNAQLIDAYLPLVMVSLILHLRGQLTDPSLYLVEVIGILSAFPGGRPFRLVPFPSATVYILGALSPSFPFQGGALIR